MSNATNPRPQTEPVKTLGDLKMFDKFTKFPSTLILLAFLLAIVAVLNRTTVLVNADAGTSSVIVQLRDDPAAVYKAKTEKAGAQVSAEQLQAYRDGLRAQQ